MKTATSTRAFRVKDHVGHTFLGTISVGSPSKVDVYVDQRHETLYARFGTRPHDVYEMSLQGETSNPALLLALDLYLLALVG